ncbi:hypothetical protein FRC11_007122, partial [Ceratobasidium sp. 423]
VQLEPVVGIPSEDEIIKVQDAIRSYDRVVSIPSMFDPRVSMELSQHLFDIQMGEFIYYFINQSHVDTPPRTTPMSNLTATNECTSDAEGLARNNPGTGADPPISLNQSTQTGSDAAIHDCIQKSNQLAEQANLLVERSNLLIERSNQIAEQANQLMERFAQPVGQPNNLVERFIELLGRLNEHFEQSNRLAESSAKPVEKLEEVLRNVNRVLVGIQHAIVRNHKGNTYNAADCLVNERGETPGQNNQLHNDTYEWLSAHFGTQPECQFPVMIEGIRHTLYLDDTRLGKFLRFYGIGERYYDDETTTGLKEEKMGNARILLSRYLSSCLG